MYLLFEFQMGEVLDLRIKGSLDVFACYRYVSNMCCVELQCLKIGQGQERSLACKLIKNGSVKLIQHASKIFILPFIL